MSIANGSRKSGSDETPNPRREIPKGLPRWVELPAAFVGLVIAVPILALAAFLIMLTSRGPVLFRQKRVGRGGQEFVMYKLRSMRDTRCGPQVTAVGDRRVTAIGRVLRKAKLDELPELWNVIRGDMALIGPRPELPQYVDRGNPLWQLIVQARPGITDPVTLRLRNEEQLLGAVDGDRERFYREELQPYKVIGYVEYLRTRSWRSDLKLLKDTAMAILRPGITSFPGLEQIRERVRSHALQHSDDCVRSECQLQ